MDEDLPRSQGQQQVFENAEGKAELIGDLAASGRANLQHKLDDQRLDDDGADAGFGERFWLGREEGLVAQERGQHPGIGIIRVSGSH